MNINNDLTMTLKSIPWFYDLPQDQLEALSTIARYCDIPAGVMLFEEGSRTDVLYILLEGQLVLETFVPTRGTVCIYQAEPLDIIGWSCMTPVVRQRTATARAKTACHMVCFDADELINACNENSQLGYVVMRRIANVIASRLLTNRLELFDIIVHQPSKTLPTTQE
jgi:CRP-like cAMP-binding protein